MPKKQKRDSAYYEERLNRDFPEIYEDLKAGKYRTLTDAAIAAGLKKPRTRIQELKNAFSKASATEQSAFLGWLASEGYSISAIPVTAAASAPITIDRRLVPEAKMRIQEIMMKRRLKLGDVMDEMGFRKLNASLGYGMSQGSRLNPDLIAALEKWLDSNAAV